MLSRAPVSSPTATIWATMPGKTDAWRRGSAMVPPRLTDSMTSAIAFSTTWLPAVLAVMSRAARSGTQAEGVPARATPVAAAELAEAPRAADRAGDEGPPLALDGVREGHGELGDRRQVAAELLEDADEDRHEEGDEADEDDQREGHDDPRVDHGRLDLPAQRVLLLELVGDAQQRLLEHAAGLAGAGHGDEERREDLGVALERAAQREPGFDVLADVGDDVGQQLVLGLRLERVERAQDRHARADHRRELTGEDRQVGRLDPLHEVEGDLLRPVLGLDVEDDQAARLQLVGDHLLGVRLHLAGGLRPG